MKRNLNIVYPIILCCLVLGVCILNYFYFGNLIYDCGREFLIPEAINDGFLPIKEIFLSYFPLSYQLNALLFKIFGSSLDTLRITGVIFSLIITIFIFFSARVFTNETKSFQITLITTFISMFNVSFIFNYVMGYSYAFIYATGFFFVSLYFTLHYFKNKNEKLLYAGMSALGICFALKSEFIFVAIPYFAMLLYKKTPPKKAVFSLILFLAPVVLSFGLLFLKGFRFSDLVQYFIFLKNFAQSKVFAFYNKTVFYGTPGAWFSFLAQSLLKFAGVFILLTVCLLLPLKKAVYPLAFMLLFILTILKGHFCAHELFSYLCILMLPLAFFSKNEKYVFCALLALFMGARFNFIYQGSYSAYVMPLALFLTCVFFMEIIKNEKLNKIFSSVMILIALVNVAYFSISNTLFLRYPLKTPKGTIFLDKKDAQNFGEILSAIDNMEGKVLILPEGHMLNYLLDKKTDLMLYQLLPNHIEVMGENNIIERLSAMPSDYILISNADYSIYGTPFFCRDFGKDICKYILENYGTQGWLGHPLQTGFKIFAGNNSLSVFQGFR